MFEKLKKNLGVGKKEDNNKDIDGLFILYLYTYMYHGQEYYLKFERRISKLFKDKDSILNDLLNLLKLICENLENKAYHKKIDYLLNKYKMIDYIDAEILFKLETIDNLTKIITNLADVQDDYLVEKYLEGKANAEKKETNKYEIECYLKKADEDRIKIIKKMYEYGDIMLLLKAIVNTSEYKDLIPELSKNINESKPPHLG